MLWFFKYFRRKNQQKIWRFWLKTKLNFEKNDHNIVFSKNANFFAENWEKSQKIVTITSSPGRFDLATHNSSGRDDTYFKFEPKYDMLYAYFTKT
jgi:hypothetical protein